MEQFNSMFEQLEVRTVQRLLERIVFDVRGSTTVCRGKLFGMLNLAGNSYLKILHYSIVNKYFQPNNQLKANQFYPTARNSSLYFIRHHDLYLCHKRANSWQTVSRQQHSLGTREKICQADSSSFVLTLLPAIVRKWLLSVAKLHSIYVLDLIIILLFDNNNVIIA